MKETPQEIAICVCTYLRPKGLVRLLRSLEAMSLEGVEPRLSVVVADNDPLGSAEAVVEKARQWFPWPITYIHERRRGIPQARNAALDGAPASADWLAFVDDDVTVDPQWLVALLRLQRATGVEIVTGPAVARFEVQPPRWLELTNWFDSRRHPTGSDRVEAATHNVLFSRAAVQRAGVRFDDRLALAGGEDTMFFKALHAAGATILWADDAIVYEHIPASRLSVRWLLMRSFRIGNTVGHVSTHSDGVPRPAVIRRGISQSLRATVLLPSALLLGGPRRRVGIMRQVAIGLGMVLGGTGWLYQEYRETHGS